jgi:hypothetical protein
MACHEIAGLRLGLMRVLGRHDEAERQHELAEIGDAVRQPGPIRALCETGDLAGLLRTYESAIALLEERVSKAAESDPELPYLRTLIVLTKKVELDLQHKIDDLTRFYQDLERMHDFVHELYPET